MGVKLHSLAALTEKKSDQKHDHAPVLQCIYHISWSWLLSFLLRSFQKSPGDFCTQSSSTGPPGAVQGMSADFKASLMGAVASIKGITDNCKKTLLF